MVTKKEEKPSPFIAILPVSIGLSALIWYLMRTRGPANLHGVVSSYSTGSPIDDVLMAVNSVQTKTDINGSYLLSDLEARKYELYCFKQGYRELTGFVILAKGDNEFNIELIPDEMILFELLFEEHWT